MTGPGNHLGAFAFIFWSSGSLEENKLALAVENGNGNPPTVPAEDTAVN
jgi:hypothetical protein